jgi:protein O-GlcNAc transferase
MPDPRLQPLLASGIQALQAGQHAAAAIHFTAALEVAPDHPNALMLLGVTHQLAGRHDDAVTFLTRASSARPDDAIILTNLGEALRCVGRAEEAIGPLERAAALNPQLPEPLYNAGVALQQLGRPLDAEDRYRRALERNPGHIGALINLAGLLQQSNDSVRAEQLYLTALRIKPDSPQALRNLASLYSSNQRFLEASNLLQKALRIQPGFTEALDDLGCILQNYGKVEEAIKLHLRAVETNPRYAPAYTNLANAYSKQGKLGEAYSLYRRIVDLKPDSHEAWYNLASVAQTATWLDEAAEGYRRCAELRPDLVAPHNNYANVRKDQARLVEAIEAFSRAAELGEVSASHNLLYTLLYSDDHPIAHTRAAHEAWGKRWADPLRENHEFPNAPTVERKLRVGYVSPYFRQHALGLLLDPIVGAHDLSRFELVFYSDSTVKDALTSRLTSRAMRWYDTSSLSDARLAELIRHDQIDVLVELTSHMAQSRLRALARKPAPVQLSYLAYPAATGMSAIDGTITDVHLDPPENDAHYVEPALRLPVSYWCYAPGDPTPDVAPLPADRNGFVTFGELNNYCKMSERCAGTYAHVLAGVPNSRLRILIHGDLEHNTLAIRRLTDAGVPRDRIDFINYQPRDAYLREYANIDIVLDPFPCNGHTSSLDALWMGAPTISLAGEAAFGRAGVSILTNLGLTELLADSEDHYVELATRLAHDLPRLRQLRATLRDRMIASPIHDARRQARDLESIYTAEFRKWCDKPPVRTGGRPRLSVCVVLKNRSRRRLDDGTYLELFPNLVRSLRGATLFPSELELVVADFHSTDWPLSEWLAREAGEIRVKVVPCDGAFSRGRGRNIAARAATSDVLFFCDADMLLPPGLLVDLMERTRNDTAVFPLNSLLDRNNTIAAFCATGFGNALLTRAAFERTQGWPEYESWGGEDNFFYENCRRVGPTQRPHTPSLMHQWHPTVWNDEASSTPRLSEWTRDAGPTGDVNAPPALTVACVFAEGGGLPASAVVELKRAVQQHLRRAHRFVCLTNSVIDGVECLPLRDDFPAAFAPLELLRPSLLSGPVLYLELSPPPTAPLDPLLASTSTPTLTPTITPTLTPTVTPTSAHFDPKSLVPLYHAFLAHPESVLARHGSFLSYLQSHVTRT